MDEVIYLEGKKINTYRAGKGEVTCVLLSGSAVLSPKWEYMKLVHEMAQYCSVIVIEKLGYGLSELTDCPRKIDTIVDEYRAIGEKLQIKTPVVLMAHSMGFLEAIRWTQRFPDEVKGIIGLDPATPQAYQDFNIEKQMKGIRLIAKSKIIKKIIAEMTLRRLEKEKQLIDPERQQLRALLPTQVASVVWLSEAQYLRKNIDVINEGERIEVPLLFFISNGQGTSMTKKVWRDHATNYLASHKRAEYECVEHPHNLYDYIPKAIADRAKQFILEL